MKTTPSSGTTEFVFNGNIELNDGWTGVGVNITTSERSTAQVHSGTYSWLYEAQLFAGTESDTWTTHGGTTYFVSLWVYNDTNTAVSVSIRKGDDSDFIAGSGEKAVTNKAWSKVEFEYTEGAGTGGNGAFMKIGALVPAITVYFDDVSVVSKVSKSPDPLYKKTLNEKLITVTPDVR